MIYKKNRQLLVATRTVLMMASWCMVLFAWGCSDDEPIVEEDQHLIFGSFFGFCVGEECIETFKLTESKLFEDTLDRYSLDEFEFVQLDQRLFEEVRGLMDFFPDQLWQETERSLGCPDCADQGGFYIEYQTSTRVQSWRIDRSKSSVPKYLHPFMDKVAEAIATINK